MIKVAVFDDVEERLLSLIALFNTCENIECVGTFADCIDLKSSLACNPDVVLMDIRMPEIDGIEATRQIKTLYPDIKVIIQTVFDDDEKIFLSLKAGAQGYILKSTSSEKIIQCVEDVYNGGAVMNPSIALRVTKFFNSTEHSSKNQLSQELTLREKEILLLLTEGLSYKMVAANLEITYNTVNSHIKKIYEKLSVNSLGEAISVAIKNHIV